METFQEVATELSKSFVQAKRTNGDTFWRLSERAADWLGDNFMHECHQAVDGPGCRLPDDEIYRVAALAADWLTDFEDAGEARDDLFDFADTVCQIYSAALFDWAESASNRELIAEAAEEFGEVPCRDVLQWMENTLRRGYLVMASRITEYLIESVEAEAERREASGSLSAAVNSANHGPDSIGL